VADKLADFVVGIGVKGQTVAMTEINKIKKAGKELSKQKNKINLSETKSLKNSQAQLRITKEQARTSKTQNDAAKAQEKRFEQVQNSSRAGSVAIQSAMTSGVGAVASQTPLIGSFFGASQSAIESAAQEFVAGVTASKNILLVRANYAKAFSGAVGDGMQRAISGGMFSDRAAKSFYTSLADQGVKAQTAVAAAPGLDLLARSQGVGSIDELMGRLQSGTLKENAGLSKADITLLQSQSQLLNNRFTSDVGAQMITQTLQRLAPQMRSVAGTQPMRGLAGAVRTEGNIQEAEQNYSAGATSLFGGSYEAMNRGRTQDRAMRARLQGAARRVNNVGRNIADRAIRLGENVAEHGLIEGYRRSINQTVEDMRQNRGITDDTPVTGTLDTGNYEEEGPERSPQAVQVDSLINEMLRNGRAIANTLMDINNQLSVTRAQLRRA